jgi:hypothetical protein
MRSGPGGLWNPPGAYPTLPRVDRDALTRTPLEEADRFSQTRRQSAGRSALQRFPAEVLVEEMDDDVVGIIGLRQIIKDECMP